VGFSCLDSSPERGWSKEMNAFQDKVVLITGAGKGAGRCLAKAFSAQGAIVAANDITPINLDATIEAIVKSGGRAKDYVADISKKMPVQTMVNQVLADWGRIDILITNARVEPRAALLEMDEWDWQRTLGVNLTGAFLCLQVVGRVMATAGQGVIVHLIQSEQLWGNKAAAQASNAGLRALIAPAAHEMEGFNIQVNGVMINQDPGENLSQRVLGVCRPAGDRISGQILGLEKTW